MTNITILDSKEVESIEDSTLHIEKIICSIRDRGIPEEYKNYLEYQLGEILKYTYRIQDVFSENDNEE